MNRPKLGTIAPVLGILAFGFAGRPCAGLPEKPAAGTRTVGALRQPPQLTPECAALQPVFEALQAALELRDWYIFYLCELHPELGEKALGVSAVNAPDRTVTIWINPKVTDPVEIATHEMLHVVMDFVRAADSELVEEQFVRVLTRLVYVKPEPPK